MRIAVIGDGIAGLCTAFRLLQANYKVTIYTAPRCHKRASDAAQGVICNKGLLLPQKPLFAAKLNSLAWVKSWLKTLETISGESIDKDFSSVKEPYRDSAQFQKIAGRIYKGDLWGCFKSSNRPGKHAPWSDDSLGYLEYQDEGWFDCRHVLRVLRSFSESKCEDFIESEVHRFTQVNSKIQVYCDSDIKEFDRIVLANGWGMNDLAENSKLSLPRLRPASGHTLKVKIPENIGNSIVVSGTKSLIVRSDKAYLGSTTIKSSSPTNEELEESIQSLKESLHKDLFARNVSEKWAFEPIFGVRSFAKDRAPIFGELAPSVYCIGAFFKNGLQFSDFLATALTQTISGLEVHPLAHQFSVHRFNR